MSAHKKDTYVPDKSRLIILACLLLFLYVVVPRLGSFSDSFSVLASARPLYVIGAVAVLAATFFAAAGIYWQLAWRPLAYRTTLAVQVASTFANRLLPAGLGGMTLYARYLQSQRHSTAEAIAVVSMNGLVGLAGHLVVLAGLLAFSGRSHALELNAPSLSYVWLFPLLAVAAAAVALAFFSKLRKNLLRLTGNIIGQVTAYRRHPHRLLAALGMAVLLTCSYVLIFYMCALSLDVHLSIVQIFLVFTLGVAAASATPTPGGLVGAEAGLTGGLIAFGVQPELALAVALLYRFITYWLPLLPAFLVFVRTRRFYLH